MLKRSLTMAMTMMNKGDYQLIVQGLLNGGKVAIIQKRLQPTLATYQILKQEKKQNIPGYLLKLIIKICQVAIFFPSKSGKFGYFFLEKSFVQVKIVFFKSKFGETSPVKESLRDKRIQPNLALGQRGKQKSLGIMLYFGDMLQPIV